jgi:hypothetical protein
MSYNNMHYIFKSEDDPIITATLTKDNDLWLSISTHPTHVSVGITLGQANQIIDALSSAVGEYEEAKALAEYDSQRDSIFEGAE